MEQCSEPTPLGRRICRWMRELIYFVLALVALAALLLTAWGLWPLLLYTLAVSLVPLSLGVGVRGHHCRLALPRQRDVAPVKPRRVRCGGALAGGRGLTGASGGSAAPHPAGSVPAFCRPRATLNRHGDARDEG